VEDVFSDSFGDESEAVETQQSKAGLISVLEKRIINLQSQIDVCVSVEEIGKVFQGVWSEGTDTRESVLQKLSVLAERMRESVGSA
jgi:hypothetical protein